MVARRAHNPEVVGSSPASATIKVLKSVDFSTFFIPVQDRFKRHQKMPFIIFPILLKRFLKPSAKANLIPPFSGNHRPAFPVAAKKPAETQCFRGFAAYSSLHRERSPDRFCRSSAAIRAALLTREAPTAMAPAEAAVFSPCWTNSGMSPLIRASRA